MQGSADVWAGKPAAALLPASARVALALPASPPPPAPAAVTPSCALNTPGLVLLCWPPAASQHWGILALLPLGPFRLYPTAGMWEAGGFGEGSAAIVPDEEDPRDRTPLPAGSSAPPWSGWGTSIFLLSLPQPIDYEGFRLFMKTYLEADVPEELCQHLFTSFKRKICQASPETQHPSPSISQVNTLGEPALSLPPSQAHCGMTAPWAHSHTTP